MNQKLKLSVIVTVILLVTSFMPVLQVIVMVANGGFLSLFDKEYSIITDIINVVLSLLFLLLFFFAKRKPTMIMSIVGFLFFFFSFLSFAFEKIIPEDPYFFMPLLNGFLSGLALMLVAFLSSKKRAMV